MCENKSAPGWSVSSTILEISNGCATRKVICAIIKAVNYCCARQRFHARRELHEFSRWPVTIHGQTASVTGVLNKHSSKKPKKQPARKIIIYNFCQSASSLLLFN